MAIRNGIFLVLTKLILIALLITSCDTAQKVDVSQIQIDYSLQRFEQDVFNSELNMSQKVPILKKEYGPFFERFNLNILKTGSYEDEQVISNLKNFVYDSDIQHIYKKVQDEYGDFSTESADLKNGLKYYHHYLPEKTIPRVITFISGFNYAIAVTDSTLAIGLDMYMGPDFSYYEMLRFPQYRRNRLDKEYVVKDALLGWLQSEYLISEEDQTFLGAIIHQGKLLYTLSKLLPEKNPEAIIGYSKEQYDWCQANEEPMWTHFVSNKLFYNTQFKEYHKYINEGPFTPGFDRQSPDQTGYYLGWQLVKSYMANNPNITIEALLNNDNAKEILTLSGYKPL